MNWGLAILILVGTVALYTLCMFWAVIESEMHKRKEAKRWQDWANKRGK